MPSGAVRTSQLSTCDVAQTMCKPSCKCKRVVPLAGWFCGAAPLVSKLRLRVKDKQGDKGAWREVEVPKSVRALVLLNLQSYGGGRDLWGLSDNRPMAEQGFSEPIFDDGLIEVGRSSLLVGP